MATSSRTLSPGGSLLRASRMFSLPPALSTPPKHNTGTRWSDTGTAPFPTLQTITAPDNFRHRGDWGFKRYFPLRSTAKTSTPHLRINQVDSVEHVTDYNSAAEHSLTLEKFQEMNLVITLPKAPDITESEKPSTFKDEETVQTIFDDKYDFTVLDKDKITKAGHRRWKYGGPWLANIAEGELQKYIKFNVRGRRVEFREFMRKQMAPRLTQEASARSMDEGKGDQKVPAMRAEDVTDEHITRFLQEARDNENARAILYQYVSNFLDLPPCTPGGIDYTRMAAMPGEKVEVKATDDPYSVTGPPITHPSAGLSYLRTNAYLENNPVYGPQARHRPVKARYLNLEGGYRGSIIGVGGFVTQSSTVTRASYQTDQDGTVKHGHNEPGGPTLWVNVLSAHVDSSGRAVVHNVEADSQARMIEQERQGEKRLFRAKSEDALLEQERVRNQKIREEKGASTWSGPRPNKGVNAPGRYQDSRSAGAISYGVDEWDR